MDKLADALRYEMGLNRMNEATTSQAENPPVTKSPLAQELIWTLASLLTGLLVLPAMIYAIGGRMFGVYKGVNSSTGLAAFYADYAHDIAAAHLPACTLAIGPLLLVYLVRLTLGHLRLNLSWIRKLKKPEPESE